MPSWIGAREAVHRGLARMARQEHVGALPAIRGRRHLVQRRPSSGPAADAVMRPQDNVGLAVGDVELEPYIGRGPEKAGIQHLTQPLVSRLAGLELREVMPLKQTDPATFGR